MDVILFWNDVALEVHRRDFTRTEDGRNAGPTVGGPTRVSRALAIVHAAIYNAQEAVAPAPGGPQPYAPPGLPAAGPVPAGAHAAGAVAGAAVAALKKLWPMDADFIDERLQAFYDQQIAAGLAPRALSLGADYGETLGLALVEHRRDDGHDRPDDNAYLRWPWHHQPDPMNPGQKRLSTHWGHLRPFLIPVGGGGVVSHAAYLGPPPGYSGMPLPPAVSPRYDAAHSDVQQLGSAQTLHPLPGQRTPEQTEIGIFWGYDGARGLGVPPRLYNQIIRQYMKAQVAAGVAIDDARAALLLARVNMAMADAAIVAWGAKYHYDLWRPVVGIRQYASGHGPNHGASAGPLPAQADPGWLPLGAPQTNTAGAFSRTPDFPAYPSGHATFGAAAFRVAAITLADWKNATPGVKKTTPDAEMDLVFDMHSDECDGRHTDPRGDVRTPVVMRRSLGQAVVDNAVSRVYLGVHWRFDGLGTVAPAGLGAAVLPADPAAGVALPPADEQRLGGVGAGLLVAQQVAAALP